MLLWSLYNVTYALVS